MSSNKSNTFYLAFKDKYPCWPLMGSAFAFGFIAMVGISLNISVIYITAKSKSLRSSANYLLALTSLFEILHQLGHFLFVYTAFSGVNFIDFRLAIHIATPSLFGLFALNLSMFFTGLDRFICIILPNLSKSIKIGPYLALQTLCCIIVGIYITVLFYIGAEKTPYMQITGTIGDWLEGSAGSFYTKYGLITNSLTITIYLITGFILRRQSAVNIKSTARELMNRRLFRSLFAIISCNVGGYFIVAIYLVFIAPRLDLITMWFLRTVLGCACLNVSASSNAPILYITSSEYRKVFRKHFSTVFEIFSRTNSTFPTVIVRDFQSSKQPTSRQIQNSNFPK